MPDDWNKFLASRKEFAKEWDRYTGLRFKACYNG